MSITFIAAILAMASVIIAFPQILGKNWRDIWLHYKKGIISWDEVHESNLSVKRRLKDVNFQPNYIIGIGRGGTIAAGLLCSELTGGSLVKGSKMDDEKIRTPKINLDTINSTLYLRDDLSKKLKNEQGRLDRTELSNLNINISEDRKVLLIIAQSFSGSTLEKATNMVLKKGVERKNLRTATLFWQKQERNIDIVHEPDIYGKIISTDKTMPWKRHKVTTDRY